MWDLFVLSSQIDVIFHCGPIFVRRRGEFWWIKIEDSSNSLGGRQVWGGGEDGRNVWKAVPPEAPPVPVHQAPFSALLCLHPTAPQQPGAPCAFFCSLSFPVEFKDSHLKESRFPFAAALSYLGHSVACVPAAAAWRLVAARGTERGVLHIRKSLAFFWKVKHDSRVLHIPSTW